MTAEMHVLTGRCDASAASLACVLPVFANMSTKLDACHPDS